MDHLCDSKDYDCAALIEKAEDTIYEWWNTRYVVG